MAADIGKGDWVQCIDASSEKANRGCAWEPGAEVTEGCVYVVDEAFLDGFGLPAITLVGRSRAIAEREYGFRVGYNPARFRPLGGNTDTLTAPPQHVRETQNA